MSDQLPPASVEGSETPLLGDYFAVIYQKWDGTSTSNSIVAVFSSQTDADAELQKRRATLREKDCGYYLEKLAAFQRATSALEAQTAASSSCGAASQEPKVTFATTTAAEGGRGDCPVVTGGNRVLNPNCAAHGISKNTERSCTSPQAGHPATAYPDGVR